MSKMIQPTRRSFLKVGAVAAAPLAAAVPMVAMASESEKARLVRLESEGEIRALHQSWMRRVNAGARADAARLYADPRAMRIEAGLRSVLADQAGEGHVVEVSTDGASATGRLDCQVEVEHELEQDCTLAKMAHAQGMGCVRHSERRVLAADYVRTEDGWAIARLELRQA